MDAFGELESELESMAAAAAMEHEEVCEAAESVSRWQRLFGYSSEEAADRIREQREHLRLIPEALWQSVQEAQEALGHDRESYSHWIFSSPPKQNHSYRTGGTAVANADREYLLKLEEPLSAALIQDLACLESPPKLLEGHEEEDNDVAVWFCRVDGNTKNEILLWLAEHAPGMRPTFVSISMAQKDLDSHSISPTLGVSATLPQHRLASKCAVPRPQQDEYPVWYFFYGTLADEEFLCRLLDVTTVQLEPAEITGGKLAMWNKKYKALLDQPGGKVTGHAYVIESKEHEDKLRAYETQAYEVVRCCITLSRRGDVVAGCTFCFRNSDGQIDRPVS